MGPVRLQYDAASLGSFLPEVSEQLRHLETSDTNYVLTQCHFSHKWIRQLINYIHGAESFLRS
jgi:hypothetical protein